MNNLINGDALTCLKDLPDSCVNCCVTSPPYWALRDYQIKEDIVWDSKEGCEHEWITERTPRPNGGGTASDKSFTKRKGVDNFQRYVDNKDRASYSNFCSKCNAWKGQLGLEPTYDLYIKHLCNIFDEVKRVLRKDGTCWVNIGDTYSGNKEGKTDNKVSEYLKDTTRNLHKKVNGVPPKSLCMIPFRFSIEMVNRGWILRNTIIWHKPNAMPSSIKDRFTVDFEYLFFFVKNKKYYFETQYEPHLTQEKRPDGIIRNRIFDYDSKFNNNPEAYNSPRARTKREGYNAEEHFYSPEGRNKRTVWSITTKPFSEAHFATYPEELCETPIKAGCPEEGIVLDPFLGAGTTGLVALKQNKKFIGIELNEEYIKIARERLRPYLEQTKLNGIKYE